MIFPFYLISYWVALDSLYNIISTLSLYDSLLIKIIFTELHSLPNAILPGPLVPHNVSPSPLS